MKTLLYISAGIAAAFAAKLLYDRHKAKTITDWGEMAMGEINKERHFEKENRKIRIMQVLENGATLTNNQIEELLEVSDASVTRYMDELEAEGKVVQESKGSRTYYRKA